MFYCYLTVWARTPVAAVVVDITDMNVAHVRDCLHETTVTDEMVAKMSPETEELNLMQCPNIASITKNLCDGHPYLNEIVMAGPTKITNATYVRMDCLMYLHLIYSGITNWTIENGAFKSFRNLNISYFDGIAKSSLPGDICHYRFEVQVDGDVVCPASHDVTTAQGASVSGHAFWRNQIIVSARELFW